MRIKENLIGRKFYRFTVIGDAPVIKGRGRQLVCECECGNIRIVNFADLKSGHSKSCGCLMAELCKSRFIKHGFTSGRNTHPLYNAWRSLKNRCNNSNAQNYHRYGGRGISVCEEWQKSFECFKEWAMHSGYREGLEIDRINNDGNYEPDNCRWVEHRINCQNRHQNNQYGKITKEVV